jgi:hypothetical protein
MATVVADVSFLDTSGTRRSLDDLVGGRPTVLFFLRHYG